MKVNFPEKYKDFHPVKELNFQFNRFAAGIRDEDVLAMAPRIKNYADWKRENLSIAALAEKERRFINAASYYRLAEFFMDPRDPDKNKAYEKFTGLMNDLYKNENIKRISIPYKNAYLPAVSLKGVGKKGTIVMHGGFDSFIEELYPVMIYLKSSGYDIIAFEGPGQGAMLKKQGTSMTHEWEKPVAAVLDYFKVSDVTLVGMSLGGYLALRGGLLPGVQLDYRALSDAHQPAQGREYQRLAELVLRRNLLPHRTIRDGGEGCQTIAGLA